MVSATHLCWRYHRLYWSQQYNGWWDLKLSLSTHHDVIEWKHSLCYWPFAWGICQLPVNSTHKGQWCRALTFPLNWAWINGWVNNREAGGLGRYLILYEVTVMFWVLYLWVVAGNGPIHLLQWKGLFRMLDMKGNTLEVEVSNGSHLL